MVDINEDMILNISNSITEKNNSNKKQDLINELNSTVKNNKYYQFIDDNKKYRYINSYTADDNELFKNNHNFTYNSSYNNETVYPVKIKKMAKSDIIIKDSTSKNNILKNKLETKKDKYKTKILKNKNEKQREKIYICNKCNKSYNIKNSYQKHLLTHEPKKYICTKCDSRFSIKSKLKRHLLIHSEIKEFKCSMCDSAFHLKYNLKVHMRVHNNEKPYICGYPGCFAKFAQKNNLNSHSKTHEHNERRQNDEIKSLLKYHNNVIKFNKKQKNLIAKLEELNKLAFNG